MNNGLGLKLRAFARAQRSYGTRWAICRPRCRADSLLCDNVWADAFEGRLPPNPRLKLSARGGRVVGNGSVLSAAAAGRSLSSDPLGRLPDHVRGVRAGRESS